MCSVKILPICYTSLLLYSYTYIVQTWFSEKYFSRYRQKRCFRKKKIKRSLGHWQFPQKIRKSSENLKYTKKREKMAKHKTLKSSVTTMLLTSSNFDQNQNLRHLAISSKIRSPSKNTKNTKRTKKKHCLHNTIFRLVLVKSWVFDPPACSYIELSNIVLNKYQPAFSWMYFCGYANGSNCYVIKYQYLVPFL